MALSYGFARLTPNRRLVAGERAEFVLTYTAGKFPIEKGGGIRITLPTAWSRFQTDRPQHPGFTTASSSAQVELELRSTYSSQPGVAQYLYVTVAKGRIDPGQSIRVVYGDKSQHGPGSQVQVVPQSYFEKTELWWGSPMLYFAVAVDSTGSGQYESIGDGHLWDGLIVAGRPVRLAVTTPSVVALGEPLTANVVAIDRYGNDTQCPAITSVTVLSDRQEEIRPLISQRYYGWVVGPIVLDKPDVYRVEVRAEDGLFGLSNPTLLNTQGVV